MRPSGVDHLLHVNGKRWLSVHQTSRARNNTYLHYHVSDFVKSEIIWQYAPRFPPPPLSQFSLGRFVANFLTTLHPLVPHLSSFDPTPLYHRKSPFSPNPHRPKRERASERASENQRTITEPLFLSLSSLLCSCPRVPFLCSGSRSWLRFRLQGLSLFVVWI